MGKMSSSREMSSLEEMSSSNKKLERQLLECMEVLLKEPRTFREVTRVTSRPVGNRSVSSMTDEVTHEKVEVPPSEDEDNFRRPGDDFQTNLTLLKYIAIFIIHTGEERDTLTVEFMRELLGVLDGLDTSQEVSGKTMFAIQVKKLCLMFRGMKKKGSTLPIHLGGYEGSTQFYERFVDSVRAIALITHVADVEVIAGIDLLPFRLAKDGSYYKFLQMLKVSNKIRKILKKEFPNLYEFCPVVFSPMQNHGSLLRMRMRVEGSSSSG